jgi:glycosyltransferase 2 family protein
MGLVVMRKQALLALKFGLAVVLLVFVMANLPWHDQVTLADADGARVFAGTLVGDWRTDHVRFAPGHGIEQAALPAQWLAQLRSSPTVGLTRAPNVSWTPSLPTVLRAVEVSGVVLACLLLCAGVLLQTTRWWRLLAAVACPTPWSTALRLYLYGLFFSLVVPGQTGGDVVRGVLVARQHPGRRAAAFVSVLLDRILSLLVLAALGAVAVVAEGARFLPVRNPVLIALCAGSLLAGLYASSTLRRALHYRRWLERLPMSASLLQADDAFLVYGRRVDELAAAALLSLGNHLCVAFAILTLGRAFGDAALSVLQYVAVSSIGNIASALPITPGGWGVGEAAYQYLFGLVGGDGTIGVAVSIAFKLLFGLIGLCGGGYLFFSRGRREMRELRQAQARS